MQLLPWRIFGTVPLRINEHLTELFGNDKKVQPSCPMHAQIIASMRDWLGSARRTIWGSLTPSMSKLIRSPTQKGLHCFWTCWHFFLNHPQSRKNKLCYCSPTFLHFSCVPGTGKPSSRVISSRFWRYGSLWNAFFYLFPPNSLWVVIQRVGLLGSVPNPFSMTKLFWPAWLTTIKSSFQCKVRMRVRCHVLFLSAIVLNLQQSVYQKHCCPFSPGLKLVFIFGKRCQCKVPARSMGLMWSVT